MTYKQHLPNFQTMIKRQSYNVTRMIKQVLCFVLWEKEENATSGHRRRQQQAVDKISGISLCSRNTQAFNFVMVNENKNPSFGNEAICYLIIMKDVTYLLKKLTFGRIPPTYFRSVCHIHRRRVARSGTIICSFPEQKIAYMFVYTTFHVCTKSHRYSFSC